MAYDIASDLSYECLQRRRLLREDGPCRLNAGDLRVEALRPYRAIRGLRRAADDAAPGIPELTDAANVNPPTRALGEIEGER